MFGLSFSKILLLVAVIAIVWFGWRWFQRWELERRTMASSVRQNSRHDRSPRQVTAEDMVPCGVCGAYVAAHGARACARGDCPYPR